MQDLQWIKRASLLGLAFFLAILIVKPIGVSTQFSVLSGIVHSAVDNEVIIENPDRTTGYQSTNSYYDKGDGNLARSIKHPINYDFIFVLAIPLGAYVAYQFKRRQDPTKPPRTENKTAESGIQQSFAKKYLPSFLSGFLILFGARMADGCTSGHMMSGIMQGSVSGFIFAIAVFAIAIPVAMFSTRAGMRKGGLL